MNNNYFDDFDLNVNVEELYDDFGNMYAENYNIGILWGGENWEKVERELLKTS